MFVKSTCFKQVCQLLLSLIVVPRVGENPGNEVGVMHQVSCRVHDGDGGGGHRLESKFGFFTHTRLFQFAYFERWANPREDEVLRRPSTAKKCTKKND